MARIKNRTVFFAAYVDTKVEVNLPLKEVLSELSNDDLISEIENRGLFKNSNPLGANNKESVRRFLCKVLDLNYHTTKEELMNVLDDIL